MDNNSDNSSIPESKRKKISFISAVWIVPLVALIIGIMLLVDSVKDSRSEITLHISDADGIKAGTTVIKFLNVDVGRITKVMINKDHNGVVLKANVDKSVKSLLTDKAKFYLVKPRIDKSGISGINTLVSGFYIDMIAKEGGNKQKEFNILDSLPSEIKGDGIYLQLKGKTRGLLGIGSAVLYRNVEVGSVESAKFNHQTQEAEYRIFIRKPNNELIGKNTRFWVSSGLNVDWSGSSVNINTPPIGSVFSGSITFDDPENGNRGETVSNDDSFVLYSHKNNAPDSPNKNAIYLVAFFDKSVKSIQAGTPVLYKGITVGRVSDSPYFNQEYKANLLNNKYIPVRFYLDPEFFKDNSNQDFDTEQWTKSVNKVLDDGLSVSLGSDNLLLGASFLELTDSKQIGGQIKPMKTYNDVRVIASSANDISGQVNDLLAKLNQLPIDKTMNELNHSLVSLNRILDSKDTQKMTAELNATMAELRATLNGLSPQSAIYQDLQKTVLQLDQTLYKVDPLLRTLEQKPNALIFNHNQPDVIPKGKQ